MVNFEIAHVWSYRYLLRRIAEVAEGYRIKTEFVSEEYTSTTCPLCRTHDNHKRITRGLIKCFIHNKVFNAYLVRAYNILLKRKPIAPSPALSGVGVMRPRPGAGLNQARGGVAPTSLP